MGGKGEGIVQLTLEPLSLILQSLTFCCIYTFFFLNHFKVKYRRDPKHLNTHLLSNKGIFLHVHNNLYYI